MLLFNTITRYCLCCRIYLVGCIDALECKAFFARKSIFEALTYTTNSWVLLIFSFMSFLYHVIKPFVSLYILLESGQTHSTVQFIYSSFYFFWIVCIYEKYRNMISYITLALPLVFHLHSPFGTHQHRW